ncbi:MAG: protein-L-isoaspartate(D-aspartate) O-methyltransferase [Rickettsiales bacterium]
MNHIEKSSVAFHYSPTLPVTEDTVSDRIRLIMKLRNSGIRDMSVLSAMEKIPRELFVEDVFREHAYDDTALPIAFGQTISQPTIVARMTMALGIESRMRVLEIGTGSGYQAAVLAKLSRRVYTMDRHRDFLAVAEQRFLQLRLNNIVTRCGDGSKGWKEAAPFERIMVTAAANDIPYALVAQLTEGGVMVIPVGENAAEQKLLRITKGKNEEIFTETLMNVRFVPLIEEK